MAVVARVWTYRRVYDDGLLIIVLVAMGRLAMSVRTPPWLGACARAVLAGAALVLWVPLNFHYVHSTFGPRRSSSHGCRRSMARTSWCSGSP
jgi:hypothetical protein